MKSRIKLLALVISACFVTFCIGQQAAAPDTTSPGDQGSAQAQPFPYLAEITGKINRGEGTLGALVNERELHDSMEEVVAGIDDSKFARWLVKHYRKKGIKVRELELEQDSEQQE